MANGRVMLRRGKIGSRGVDVTVKSSTGWACALAPTWEMVEGHKSGHLSDEEYTKQYLRILKDAGPEPFMSLYGSAIHHKVSVLCYCRKGKFCHADILVQFAADKYPHLFKKEDKKGTEMKHLLAIDLETTGLKPGYHEITQIGAVMLDDKLVSLGEFETLVHINHPERGREDNFDVFAYTNIDPVSLETAPHLKDALRALETFARSKVGFELGKVSLFGQNPRFDARFLEEAYKSCGWKFPFDFHLVALESVYASHQLEKTGQLPEGMRLKDICKKLGVDNAQAHNAMSDVRATVDALRKMTKKVTEADKK